MGRGKQTCQGKQHFSHPHILKPIVNPTETLTCNACEQTNITNTPNFYGCNTCQYFLHENCLNAPRFLDHSSHPSHHLTLLPVPTYSNRSFICKACGDSGNGCSFSCPCCDFDVHMQCALLPQTVVLPQHHHHELELIFESPYDDDADENTVFVCDVCHDSADLNNWLYYCADCDFGTHLECAISKSVRQQEPKKLPVNKPRANRVIIRKTEEEPVKIQEINQKEEDEEEEEDGGTTNEVKIVKHFSHSHALELSEVQETEEIICSGCEDKLCGTAYTCTKPNCEFTLHKSCFELPRKLQHNSHPNHPLTLYPTLPKKDSMYFGCNACSEDPKSFVYECPECNFSLHAKCATTLPETVTREDHQHSLALQYQWPFTSEDRVHIFCEVCNGLCIDSYWLYCCAECKFGTHLHCANVKKEDGSSLENEEEEEEEEENYENMTDQQKLLMLTIKAQDQQAKLNFQTQMAYMNAQTISNMWRSTHRYY